MRFRTSLRRSLPGCACCIADNPTGASPATPKNLSLSNITCPVGLIAAASTAELEQRLVAWAPPAALTQCAGMPGEDRGGAYHRLLEPLQRLAIRGAFWHGGSADVQGAAPPGGALGARAETATPETSLCLLPEAGGHN